MSSETKLEDVEYSDNKSYDCTYTETRETLKSGDTFIFL